jgi:hypothetical protein
MKYRDELNLNNKGMEYGGWNTNIINIFGLQNPDEDL